MLLRVLPRASAAIATILTLCLVTSFAPRAHADEPEHTVRATIEADVPTAAVERAERDGRHIDWRPICSTPCQEDLSTSYGYRIRGPGIMTSSTFHLAPDLESVQIQAHTGSSKTRFTGLVLLPIGGAMVIIPPALLFMTHVPVDGSSQREHGPSDPAVAAGLTIMAVGAVAVVTGLVLILSSRTSVKMSRPAAADSARLTPGGFTF